MNDNAEDQNRTGPLPAILLEWLVYLKQIFLYALGIAALVGVSFVLTGGFSSRSYSDRLFMAGIMVTFFGVFIFITIAGTRKRIGLPSIAKTSEDARKIIEQTPELINKADKRYDAGARVWVVGIACLVLSVLFYFLLSIFRI